MLFAWFAYATRLLKHNGLVQRARGRGAAGGGGAQRHWPPLKQLHLCMSLKRRHQSPLPANSGCTFVFSRM